MPFHTHASVSLPNGFPKPNLELEHRLTALYDAQPKLVHEGHEGQIENVLSCLEQGVTTSAITGEDGRRTIEIITGIYKSGATHQPVRLPLRKDDPFYTVEGIRANASHYFEKKQSKADLEWDIQVEANYGKKA